MSGPRAGEGIPLLEMRAISKSFGGVRANDGIGLSLRAGEVLGLLGENGAGKTTLMNILFGVYRADAGEILVDGRPAAIARPADALGLGVGMVHQHFQLSPRLTVLENLVVGLPGKAGRIDRAGALARLREIEDRYGLGLSPDRPVAALAVGEQQRLEIVKALFRGARILILDEPTAVLTPAETQGLFRAIAAMAARGLGIILITHKLREVRAFCTTAMVLRHGRVVGGPLDPGGVGEGDLARMMCGVDIEAPVREPVPAGPELLSLDAVSTAGQGVDLHEVSLSVRGGEILGLAGVSGNGQKALADVVAGLVAPRAGRIGVAGEPVPRPTPLRMQARGVGRIPEDRMTSGLVTTLPLASSMVLPRIGQAPFSRRGILRRRAIADFAKAQIAAFDIRCRGPFVRAGTLSGGNLQKALLARELAFDPKVVIAAQPTRGLDVGAARFVHERFLDLRRRGRAVLVISEDLEELIALSDRIAVIHGGRIAGILPAAQASVERLGLMMAGAGTGE